MSLLVNGPASPISQPCTRFFALHKTFNIDVVVLTQVQKCLLAKYQRHRQEAQNGEMLFDESEGETYSSLQLLQNLGHKFWIVLAIFD